MPMSIGEGGAVDAPSIREVTSDYPQSFLMTEFVAHSYISIATQWTAWPAGVFWRCGRVTNIRYVAD